MCRRSETKRRKRRRKPRSQKCTLHGGVDSVIYHVLLVHTALHSWLLCLCVMPYRDRFRPHCVSSTCALRMRSGLLVPWPAIMNSSTHVFADLDVQNDRNKLPSHLFFKYNTALGPPYRILVDTNFINFSIQNKLDVFQSMMDCLLAKCTVAWFCNIYTYLACGSSS